MHTTIHVRCESSDEERLLKEIRFVRTKSPGWRRGAVHIGAGAIGDEADHFTACERADRRLRLVLRIISCRKNTGQCRRGEALHAAAAMGCLDLRARQRAVC